MEYREGEESGERELPGDNEAQEMETERPPRSGKGKRPGKPFKKAPMDGEGGCCNAKKGRGKCATCAAGGSCSGRSDGIYASGFAMDAEDVADILEPGIIRMDLKCGKGAISQGEKCTKGAATRANASEKATMALGIAGAAASTAGVIHSLRKGNMVNFERSLAGVSGSVAVAAAGKAAYEQRMGHTKTAEGYARGAALNAALAGAAAYRAGGEARDRNRRVGNALNAARTAKAKSNDYFVGNLKSAQQAGENARSWAARGEEGVANSFMASAQRSVEEGRAFRAAGRAGVRQGLSELKKVAPYSAARRRRAIKQGESPLTAYLNY